MLCSIVALLFLTSNQAYSVQDMIPMAALAAVKKHKSLLAGQAENFVATFLRGVDKLSVAQDKLTESH
jgi:hypothetical protein